MVGTAETFRIEVRTSDEQEVKLKGAEDRTQMVVGLKEALRSVIAVVRLMGPLYPQIDVALMAN